MNASKLAALSRPVRAASLGALVLSLLLAAALPAFAESTAPPASLPEVQPGTGAAASGPVAEPDGYRLDEYRKPVPATLKGATVLSAQAASELWSNKGAIFIDVYPKAP